MDESICSRNIIYMGVNVADVAIVTGTCKYDEIHIYSFTKHYLMYCNTVTCFLYGRFTLIS